MSALGAHSFDLIVAEGLAVSGAIARIREATRNQVPVVVVAPAGDVEARIAFLEAGADDVIAAGFSARELEARVEALLIRTGRGRPAGPAGDGAGRIVTFFSPEGRGRHHHPGGQLAPSCSPAGRTRCRARAAACC